MIHKVGSARILEACKRSNREWLQKPAVDVMKARSLAYIEEDLPKNTPAALLNVADSLGRLATMYAVSGEVALLDGNSSGWNEIHRSWLYTSTAVRVRITVFN